MIHMVTNLLINYLGTKNIKDKLIDYAIPLSNPFDYFLSNKVSCG